MRKNKNEFGRDLFGFRNDINDLASMLFTKKKRATKKLATHKFLIKLPV